MITKPPKIVYAGDLLCLVDEEDYELVMQYKWYSKKGYIRTSSYGERFYMHRLIMKAAPDQIIDHINNDPSDNRKHNLRFVSKSFNLQRTNHRQGCYYDKRANRWLSYISVNGKKVYIGRFKTQKAGSRAYYNMRKQIIGE